MAVDTREKRLAFLEFGGGYSWHTLFNPDGSITSIDRGNLLGLVDLTPSVLLDISLGDTRLAPVLYSGFRLKPEINFLAVVESSSIVTADLSVAREHKLISIPSLSTIATTLDVSDQIFFVATVSSLAVISPTSLDVERPIELVIDSLSVFSADAIVITDLGNVQIASISIIDIPLFGQFVTDLGTIRLSPLSSPGYDFFVPAPVEAPFEGIISNISAMLPTLSVTKGVDGSIDSVSILVASMSTETVTFSASIDSIGVVGA